MSDKLLVLVMQPKRPPVEVEVKEEKLLGLTGGYAQEISKWYVPTPPGVCSLIREFDYDGQAVEKGIAANFVVMGQMIYGPLVVHGHNGEGEAISLTEGQIAACKEALARLRRAS